MLLVMCVEGAKKQSVRRFEPKRAAASVGDLAGRIDFFASAVCVAPGRYALSTALNQPLTRTSRSTQRPETGAARIRTVNRRTPCRPPQSPVHCAVAVAVDLFTFSERIWNDRVVTRRSWS